MLIKPEIVSTQSTGFSRRLRVVAFLIPHRVDRRLRPSLLKRKEAAMSKLVEYKVRPVERYVITRYEEDGASAACAERGEFSSPYIAQEVAFSLGKREQEALGPDATVTYPEYPSQPV